ncbi:hypothetical protein EOD42_03050 [Rhodovarius crocodyli]|uniref:Phage tail protein n=1 Tax=Rhodovarius crocodyli TaxID=1979269 RepID=A0A437MN84_9PROT|nr:phage tail tube protein [Rhodovarius crocodyli]RVT99099.1 hypothetical protein EOD42_03050 [Rhodovarius crocodyli]
MPSVTGISAGAETADVVLSYGIESAWRTPPATTFKGLRITSETLAGTKNRQRFNEITGKRQVSPSVTQSVSGGGGINFNLSYGTFDDLLAAALGEEWTSALAIDGVAGDISTVASGNKLTSTTSGKFNSVVVGQFIRLYGFTANSGANNGIYRVSAKTSGQDITLAGKTVANETPTGTAAKVRGSMLRNGDLSKSLFLQKKVGSDWFQYPGSIIPGLNLQGGINQAFTGSFNVLSAQEAKAVADASTGGIIPAPTGGFFDGVGNFGGVMVNDAAIDAVVQSTAISLSREGAAMDYGMGSATAQGALLGQVNPSGTIEVLWRNSTLYDLFMSEANSLLSWTMRDPQGNAYAMSLPAVALMNGSPQAGGPNQTVRSRFTIEGAQDLASHCIQIDRFPAVP